MNLMDRLNDTPNANKEFATWYKNNGFHLNIPIQDFLFKFHDRYKLGTFMEFFNHHNYNILVTISGYGIYIADPKFFDPQILKDKGDEFIAEIFEDIGQGWYEVTHKKVTIPENYRNTPAASLFYVRCEAIVDTMKFMNQFGSLNKNLNPLLK